MPIATHMQVTLKERDFTSQKADSGIVFKLFSVIKVQEYNNFS